MLISDEWDGAQQTHALTGLVIPSLKHNKVKKMIRVSKSLLFIVLAQSFLPPLIIHPVCVTASGSH